MKLALVLAVAAAPLLGGCNNSLTPAQTAALVCIATATGAIIANATPTIQADGRAICAAGQSVATVVTPTPVAPAVAVPVAATPLPTKKSP